MSAAATRSGPSVHGAGDDGRRLAVALYSDKSTTRDKVRRAVGRRPAADLPLVEISEFATLPALLKAVDSRRFDVLVLDGEAAPAGGLGVCRQLHDEIYDCPPVLVLTGRPQDAWLAAWSRADAAVPHPLDPRALADAVASLARLRAATPPRVSGAPETDALEPDAPETDAPETDAPTWAEVLEALAVGRHLDAEQTRWALDEVMRGEADDARLAGLLVGLRAKGETVEEVAGLAEAMLSHAVALRVPGTTVDIVGTGGDGAHTVNISTMASLVAAGAGATVVKHGNRAASSRCGTADVLEELGLDLEADPDRVAAAALEHRITFAFAPRFHPAMRFVGPVRRSLGIRTVFNSLGPLTNPARPAAMALGVADARHAGIIAGVLAARGTTALVVRGQDGLDELTTSAPTNVRVVVRGEVVETVLEAADVGMPTSTVADLRGGDRVENAAVVRDVLAGRQGPVADVVVLNAAAGLLALDLVGGTRGSADVAADLPGALAPCIDRARESLRSGAAEAVLRSWLG